jgi:large subunit ribosomal protein L4
MKLDEINIDGKNIGNVELSKNIFFEKPRMDIIQRVVEWQKSRFFKKTGHTKGRSDVAGSRKKIYAQKGTGGARHGNATAPIFVGGGIAHGPSHRGKYAIKRLNKKVKKLGLKHAISCKAIDKKIAVLNTPTTQNMKTKNLKSFMSKINSKSALLIHHKDFSENFLSCFRNIPNTKRLLDVGTNVYDLIKYEKVLITKESLESLEKRLAK